MYLSTFGLVWFSLTTTFVTLTGKEMSKVLLNITTNKVKFLRLLMMRKPLPLAGPMADFWSKITKVIDNVHLGNHKRPACKEDYHPNQVKDIILDANLMICEETYAWCGRFKKILNYFPKTMFHFMLHHLVKMRNRYTEYCYR